MGRVGLCSLFCRRKVGFRPGETILEKFLRTCDELKSFSACVDDHLGKLRYGTVKYSVILLAQEFRRCSDEKIGVMLPASIGAYIVIFSLLLAGKIPVMMNWSQGRREIRASLQKSGVRQVISSSVFIKHLIANSGGDFLKEFSSKGDLDSQVVLLEELRKKVSWSTKIKSLFISLFCSAETVLKKFQVQNKSGDDVAVILFTSGTEKLPKCVPLTNKNLLTNQKGCLPFFHITEKDSVVTFLPPFHAYGLNCCSLFPLLVGVPVVFVSNPLNTKKIISLIFKENVTIMGSTPTFYSYFLKKINKTPHLAQSLQQVILGGECVSNELYKESEEVLPQVKVLQGYGATECSPVITLMPANEKREGVGVVLSNIEVLVVDRETFVPKEAGEEGLVIVAGDSVFGGYLNDEGNAGFVSVGGKRYYNTGDIGYFSQDRHLVLVGRLSRFVKVGGEMISLESVESVLKEALLEGHCEDKGPSLVVCGSEVFGKSRLILVTTLKLTLEEINTILRKSGMSSLIKISEIKKVSTIPLSGIGKPNYVLLNKIATGKASL